MGEQLYALTQYIEAKNMDYFVQGERTSSRGKASGN